MFVRDQDDSLQNGLLNDKGFFENSLKKITKRCFEIFFRNLIKTKKNDVLKMKI